MAVPTTWEELKTELATLAVRDDLDDMMASFIGYAENWFQRELFTPERETSVSLSLSDGAASLPADFGGVKAIYVDGTRDVPLSEVTSEQYRTLYPTSDTGTPRSYAIEGETILIGPIPSSGTEVVLKYVEGIPALGSGQSTNWLLTDHPDLYVNASLAELNDYVRDYAEADRRRNKALIVADSISRFARRRKGNSGPLVARARSTDNVLSYLPR